MDRVNVSTLSGTSCHFNRIRFHVLNPGSKTAYFAVATRLECVATTV